MLKGRKIFGILAGESWRKLASCLIAILLSTNRFLSRCDTWGRPQRAGIYMSGQFVTFCFTLKLYFWSKNESYKTLYNWQNRIILLISGGLREWDNIHATWQDFILITTLENCIQKNGQSTILNIRANVDLASFGRHCFFIFPGSSRICVIWASIHRSSLFSQDSIVHEIYKITPIVFQFVLSV
jgi:hypothetical protein